MNMTFARHLPVGEQLALKFYVGYSERTKFDLGHAFS
jgi:hypothetical protein